MPNVFSTTTPAPYNPAQSGAALTDKSFGSTNTNPYNMNLSGTASPLNLKNSTSTMTSTPATNMGGGLVNGIKNSTNPWIQAAGYVAGLNPYPTAQKASAAVTPASSSPLLPNAIPQASSGITDPAKYYGNSSGAPTFDSSGQPVAPAQTGSAPNPFSSYSSAAQAGGVPSADNSGNTGIISPNAYNTPVNPPGGNQSVFGQANSGLLNIGQNGSDALKQAQDALLAKQNQIASVNGVDKGFGTGEQQILANQLPGYQTAVQNALQGQGQQITALTGASGATAPVANAAYFGTPETGGVVGNPGKGSTGNALIDSTVQNALQLVRNGADPTSASVMGPLNAIGAPAVNAFNSAQLNGGNYNPTASSAASQQNASQGAGFQQQAVTLDTALKQLDTISPNIQSFLQSSGLNSQDNPSYNQALNTYYGEFLNPGNKAIFEQYIGDIKKFTGQILATNSGTIPTDVANTLASFDPSNLSAAQLKPYLDNLAKLGNNQLSVLQGQSSSSYGGSSGYSGAPSSVSNAPISAPANQKASITSNDPVIQGLIGGAMNIFGGISGVAQGLASALLK